MVALLQRLEIQGVNIIWVSYWRANVMSKATKRRRKAIRVELEEPENSVSLVGKLELESAVEECFSGIEKPVWQSHLAHIRTMRSACDAPVDTLGCHMLADKLASPKRLRDHGCTVDEMIAIPTEDLEKLLTPVGFYRVLHHFLLRKALYVKQVAKILKEKYDGDIPSTVEDLCSLPGVGEKMAYLAMHNAWDQIEGLGIDTHVHRIVNRLGWVKTANPKQTRVALERMIPREEWQDLNKLLVGFGQQTCLPILPKCSECLNRDICPAIGVKKRQ